MNVDAEELLVQADSDKRPGCPPELGLQRGHQALTVGAAHSHTLAFIPCLTDSRLLVGNFRDMCLLGGNCFSSVGSPLHFLICYSKGLFMTTEYFNLWEICSFCFCFCPHRMFLSAPCEGTGNYRAIHLHPHNFRQIL